MESWINSVDTVIDYNPETICLYPLTLRDATPYKKRGYASINGADQYEKYDYAVNQLLKAGYYQETHIRFMKGNGGTCKRKITGSWRTLLDLVQVPVRIYGILIPEMGIVHLTG
jgi:oxygen-independent coproporphyrinogen-3 oxidase